MPLSLKTVSVIPFLGSWLFFSLLSFLDVLWSSDCLVTLSIVPSIFLSLRTIVSQSPGTQSTSCRFDTALAHLFLFYFIFPQRLSCLKCVSSVITDINMRRDPWVFRQQRGSFPICIIRYSWLVHSLGYPATSPFPPVWRCHYDCVATSRKQANRRRRSEMAWIVSVRLKWVYLVLFQKTREKEVGLTCRPFFYSYVSMCLNKLSVAPHFVPLAFCSYPPH